MLLLAACATPDPTDTGPTFDADPPTEIGGDRPAAVVLPSDYSVDRSWPLVVLLHGYGATSDLQDVIFGFGDRIDSLGIILVKPEGTTDSRGAQFWNATDECCDFDGSGVDDVAYLTGLLDEAETLYPIDSVRFTGHSNGGYMSYRMACEIPDRIDRIGVLAGATWQDEQDCVGTDPVSVLHVHGTEDTEVPYESNAGHAGAWESVERWSTKAGCDEEAAELGTRDYLRGDGKAETTAYGFTGCAEGIDKIGRAHV